MTVEEPTRPRTAWSCRAWASAASVTPDASRPSPCHRRRADDRRPTRIGTSTAMAGEGAASVELRPVPDPAGRSPPDRPVAPVPRRDRRLDPLAVRPPAPLMAPGSVSARAGHRRTAGADSERPPVRDGGTLRPRSAATAAGGFDGVNSHASNRSSRSCPEIFSARAMNSSVVTLPPALGAPSASGS